MLRIMPPPVAVGDKKVKGHASGKNPYGAQLLK